MSLTMAQAYCIAGVAVFTTLAAICVWGASYYGSKAQELKDKQNTSFQEETTQKLDQIVLELGKFKISGDKILVEKFKKVKNWDFSKFTIAMKVYLPTQSGTDLNLRIESKSTPEYIHLVLSGNQKFIKITYYNPDLGEITKTGKILETDPVTEEGKIDIALLISYSLDEQVMHFYINDDSRA